MSCCTKSRRLFGRGGAGSSRPEPGGETIVGYRMQRDGSLLVRHLSGVERTATEAEIKALLTANPQLVLRLAWRC